MRTLATESRGTRLSAGGRGGKAGKLFTVPNAETVTRASSPLRPTARLHGHWALAHLRSAPCSLPCSAGFCWATHRPLPPRGPRHRGRAIPPACSCLAWASPARPVPALHPRGPAGAAAPFSPAWLGRVLFLASASVIWHLNVTGSLLANIYSSKIFKFQGL